MPWWGILLLAVLVLSIPIIFFSTRQGRRAAKHYVVRLRSSGDPVNQAFLDYTTQGHGEPGFHFSVTANITDIAEQKNRRPTVTCTKCGAIVAADLKACPACNSSLVPQSASVQLAQQSLARLCPACGTAVAAGVAACAACGTAAVPPMQQPAPPAQPRMAVVLRNIVIGGESAFQKDELVNVESESPDPARPEYKYVVLSRSLNKRFRLSDNDISI